jgi:hypothetical protein
VRWAGPLAALGHTIRTLARARHNDWGLQSETARPTDDELLLFQREYQTRCFGLTGMRTRVTNGTGSSQTWCKGGNAIRRRAIACHEDFGVHADGTCRNMLSFAPGLFFVIAQASKEQAMSRKPHSLSKQLVIATALALGAFNVALADDNSMNPFIGDSYRYFNGGHNLGDRQFKGPVFSAAPADPSWRQSHPNGISERDLQALSSSSVSAAAEQLNPRVVAAAGPLLRQPPQDLDAYEHQMQALASSSASRWQVPNGSERTASASTGQVNVVQELGKETFSARLARFFHPDSSSQSGTN